MLTILVKDIYNMYVQVSVDRCSRGVTRIAAKRVSIDPGQIVTISFIVQTFYLVGNNYECESEYY